MTTLLVGLLASGSRAYLTAILLWRQHSHETIDQSANDQDLR